MMHQDEQWVSFSLGTEMFAYRVAKVKEIIPYMEPVPVPGSRSDIEGVLNVRGEIIPVVSGTGLVGVDAQNECDRIVIVESQFGQIGIAVGAMGEIFTINQSEIESSSDNSPNVLGTVLYKGRLIILLESQFEE